MKLAEPIQINSRTVPNRFVALPMEANDAEPDGTPSDRTIERYRNLARGGWGVIMLEAIAPSEGGKSRNRQLVLNRKTLPGFSRLIDAIRREDDRVVVIIQLNHAGRYALRPKIAYRHQELDSWKGITPDTPVLTDKELDEIKKEMIELAECAAESGADGADLKCCHGYLAIELLRPANRREGNYGGTFENRARIISGMLEALKKPIEKKDFIVGSRISLYEGFEGGLGDDDADDHTVDAPLCDDLTSLLSMLKAGGASWICETAGNPYLNPDIVRPHKKDTGRFATMELHHRLAARVKAAFPEFAVVGTGYTLFGVDFRQVAEKNLASGMVDLIGLGRQNFADPETPKKILNGDEESVRWCKTCPKNNCSYLLRSHMEAGCTINSDYYREQLKRLKAKEKKNG
ncbi:MAG: hypothetical protein ABIH66_08160 [bacterium]